MKKCMTSNAIWNPKEEAEDQRTTHINFVEIFIKSKTCQREISGRFFDVWENLFPLIRADTACFFDVWGILLCVKILYFGACCGIASVLFQALF